MIELPLDYKIRKTTFNDLEQATHVNIKSWRESYTDIIDSNTLINLNEKNALEKRKQFFINNPNIISYVATYKNTIIGFCDAGRLRDHPLRSKNEHVKEKAKGEIFALYILNEHKGKKLGKALVEKVASDLRTQNLSPFAVFALKNNLPGRQFYEKLGGQEFSEDTITIDHKDYTEVIYLFEHTKRTKN